MHISRLPRLIAASVVIVLLAASCGSDPEPDEATDASTSTTSSTTTTAAVDNDAPTITLAPDDGDVTTTAPTAGDPSGEFASGSVTTADGLQADWTFSGDANELCFRAELSHPDPAIASTSGTGIDNCLAPSGGITNLDDALSVDVGTIDGDKSIGFLWGRATAEILTLLIEHSDGAQTEVELIAGPGGIKVFAFVTEVAALPPVVTLDALSGTKLEDSEPIRDFLRAGPAYPVAGPVVTAAPPEYPTN